MNSGLINHFSRGKLLGSVGTHQHFDKIAYKLIQPNLADNKFPPIKLILKFEGSGGPDGLKFKGRYKTDHLWDPVNKIGHLPTWIEMNYKNLVQALKKGDLVKASFEAGFMAHYLTDSLTPAHHLSFDLILDEYKGRKYRKHWKVYGRKGLLSSHVMFESGISSILIFSRVGVDFDKKLLINIQNKGIKQVVMDESLDIAKLNLYDQFMRRGWNAKLAKSVKETVVKRIPQLVAAAWYAAYLDAYKHLSRNKMEEGKVKSTVLY